MADPKGRVSVKTQRSGASIMNDEVLRDLPSGKPKPSLSPRVSVKTQRSGSSIMNDEVLKDINKRPGISERVSVKTKRPGSGATEAPKSAVSEADKTANRAANSNAKAAWSAKAPQLQGDKEAGKAFSKSIEDIGTMNRKGLVDRSSAAVQKAGGRIAHRIPQALKAVPGLGIASTMADIMAPTPVANATIKGNKEAEAAVRSQTRSQARPGGGTSAGRSDYKAPEATPARKPAAKAAPKPAAKAAPKPASKPRDKVAELMGKGYSRADATNLAGAKSSKVTSGPK